MKRITDVLALLTIPFLAVPLAATANGSLGPRILSFVETPRTLPAAGGNVTITAKLKGAQVCQLELLSITAPASETRPTWSHNGHLCISLDEQHIRVWPNAIPSPEIITFKLVVSFFPEHRHTQLMATQVFSISVTAKEVPTTTTTALRRRRPQPSQSSAARRPSHRLAPVTQASAWNGLRPARRPRPMTYSVVVYPWEESLGGDPSAPPSVSGSVTVEVDGAPACDLPVTMTATEGYSGEVDCVVAIPSTESAATLTAIYLGDDGSMGSVSGLLAPEAPGSSAGESDIPFARKAPHRGAARSACRCVPAGHPSPRPATIRPMNDYAGAWSADRGRCHRFVYTVDDGRPATCPEPPVRNGWRREGQGRWYAVDACEQHGDQLLQRPRPAAR